MTRAKKIILGIAFTLIVAAFLFGGIDAGSTAIVRVLIGLTLLWPFLTEAGNKRLSEFLSEKSSTREGRAGIYTGVVASLVIALGLWVVALLLGSPKEGLHDARPILLIMSMVPLGLGWALLRVLRRTTLSSPAKE